ncbi:MAG: hypothetical protein RQ899_09355 [Pseudomonadales bacterium]|nr:hypothetical protein [Pseudomonadales bacterium]
MKNIGFFAFLWFPLLAVPALSQEGYPFDGTWRGTLTSGADSQPVLLIMKWDGDKLEGTVNPGRNSFPFTFTELDAPSWTLHVEAATKAGDKVDFQGVLEDTGSRNRTLKGIWNENGKEYQFQVTRE